jgi:hypothetical protein
VSGKVWKNLNSLYSYENDDGYEKKTTLESDFFSGRFLSLEYSHNLWVSKLYRLIPDSLIIKTFFLKI